MMAKKVKVKPKVKLKVKPKVMTTRMIEDKLRAKYPGETDNWYKAALKTKPWNTMGEE